jgi:hypothetical protein
MSLYLDCNVRLLQTPKKGISKHVEFTITKKKRFGTWANAFQMELKFSRRVNTLHRFHGLMALEVMQSGTHTRSINMGEIFKLNR